MFRMLTKNDREYFDKKMDSKVGELAIMIQNGFKETQENFSELKQEFTYLRNQVAELRYEVYTKKNNGNL